MCTTNAVKAAPYGYSIHRNGGGLVADTATVENSVYVGKGCRVMNYAELTGDVRVSDRSLVGDRAKLSGDVVVDLGSSVLGNVVLGGSAHITHSVVFGHVRMSENSRIYRARVS